MLSFLEFKKMKPKETIYVKEVFTDRDFDNLFSIFLDRIAKMNLFCYALHVYSSLRYRIYLSFILKI